MPTKRKRHRVSRDELPIYEHRRFRCPRCDSPRFQIRRSTRDNDGVSTQDQTCRGCGLRFYLIVE